MNFWVNKEMLSIEKEHAVKKLSEPLRNDPPRNLDSRRVHLISWQRVFLCFDQIDLMEAKNQLNHFLTKNGTRD